MEDEDELRCLWILHWLRIRPGGYLFAPLFPANATSPAIADIEPLMNNP